MDRPCAHGRLAPAGSSCGTQGPLDRTMAVQEVSTTPAGGTLASTNKSQPSQEQGVAAMDSHKLSMKARQKVVKRVEKAAVKRLLRDDQHGRTDKANIARDVRAVLQQQHLPGVYVRALGAGGFGTVQLVLVPEDTLGSTTQASASSSDIACISNEPEYGPDLRRAYQAQQHAAFMPDAEALAEAAPAFKVVARKFTCAMANEVLSDGVGPMANELAWGASIQAGHLQECARCKEVAYPHRVYIGAVENCKEAMMRCMTEDEAEQRSEEQWESLNGPGLLIALDYEVFDLSLADHLRWIHLPRHPRHLPKDGGALAELLRSKPLGSHAVNIIEALDLFTETAKSVDVFHQTSKCLHTDIKPDNILMSKNKARQAAGGVHSSSINKVAVADGGSAVLQAQPPGARWCYANNALYGTTDYMRTERCARRQGWAVPSPEDDDMEEGEGAEEAAGYVEDEAGEDIGDGVSEGVEGAVGESDAMKGTEDRAGYGEAEDAVDEQGEGGDESCSGCEGDWSAPEEGEEPDEAGQQYECSLDVYLADDVHATAATGIDILLGCPAELADIVNCMALFHMLCMNNVSTRVFAEQLMATSQPLQQAVAATQADGEALLAYLEELRDQGPAGRVLMDAFHAIAQAKLATFHDGRPSKNGITSYTRCTFSVGHLAQLLQQVQAQHATLRDSASQQVVIPKGRSGLLQADPDTVERFLLSALRDEQSLMDLSKYHPDIWSWLERMPYEEWPEWLAGSEGESICTTLHQQQQEWDAQQPAPYFLPSQRAAAEEDSEAADDDAEAAEDDAKAAEDEASVEDEACTEDAASSQGAEDLGSSMSDEQDSTTADEDTTQDAQGQSDDEDCDNEVPDHRTVSESFNTNVDSPCLVLEIEDHGIKSSITNGASLLALLGKSQPEPKGMSSPARVDGTLIGLFSDDPCTAGAAGHELASLRGTPADVLHTREEVFSSTFSNQGHSSSCHSFYGTDATADVEQDHSGKLLASSCDTTVEEFTYHDKCDALDGAASCHYDSTPGSVDLQYHGLALADGCTIDPSLLCDDALSTMADSAAVNLAPVSYDPCMRKQVCAHQEESALAHMNELVPAHLHRPDLAAVRPQSWCGASYLTMATEATIDPLLEIDCHHSHQGQSVSSHTSALKKAPSVDGMVTHIHYAISSGLVSQGTQQPAAGVCGTSQMASTGSSTGSSAPTCTSALTFMGSSIGSSTSGGALSGTCALLAAPAQPAPSAKKGVCSRAKQQAQRAGEGLKEALTQVAHFSSEAPGEMKAEAQRAGEGLIYMCTQVGQFACQAPGEMKTEAQRAGEGLTEMWAQVARFTRQNVRKLRDHVKRVLVCGAPSPA